MCCSSLTVFYDSYNVHTISENNVGGRFYMWLSITELNMCSKLSKSWAHGSIAQNCGEHIA